MKSHAARGGGGEDAKFLVGRFREKKRVTAGMALNRLIDGYA